MDKIVIFDTTLRDGEQAPGASMRVKEKIKIAQLLDEMGVDIIEAGFPASSDNEIKYLKKVSHLIHHAKICCLARAKKMILR